MTDIQYQALFDLLLSIDNTLRAQAAIQGVEIMATISAAGRMKSTDATYISKELNDVYKKFGLTD